MSYQNNHTLDPPVWRLFPAPLEALLKLLPSLLTLSPLQKEALS